MACISSVLAFLALGLWPFIFRQRNEVNWLPGRGIRIGENGELFSRNPWVPQTAAVNAPEAFSFEAWITPAPETFSRRSVIFSYYDAARMQNFTISQSLSDLVLQGWFRTDVDRSKFRQFFIDRLFHQNQSRFLSITSGLGGTAVFADGVRCWSNSDLFLTEENWKGILLLGHSPGGGRSWAGDISLLSIYPKRLDESEVKDHFRLLQEQKASELVSENTQAATYVFSNQSSQTIRSSTLNGPELTVPSRFVILRRNILEFPRRRQDLDWADIFVNTAGFIPFGFLFVVYLRVCMAVPPGRARGFSILIGTLTSLTIELLQVYLPTRDSSLLDLLTNIAGTALGAWLPVSLYTKWAVWFCESPSPKVRS